VVASQDKEVFRVFYLVREEETNCFQRLLPSVYIVAEEKVIRFWREAAIFE